MFRRLLPSPFRRKLILFTQKGVIRTASSNNPATKSLFRRHFRWYTIPVAFAVTFVTFEQVRAFRLKRIEQELKCERTDIGQYYRAHRFEIWLYQLLPLRMVSRAWGWINTIELPVFLREPLLGCYSRIFHCKLDEAEESNLRKYRNLQEFFCRALKPGVREIQGDGIMNLVSPSDGKVLHFGRVMNGRMEQVKGVTYSLDDFLGPQTWYEDYVYSEDDNEEITTRNISNLYKYNNGASASESSTLSENTKNLKEYEQSLLYDKSGETQLYHCIIYLAPGDYHRYHSPCSWRVFFRRHFSGRLYSVRPSFATWFPNLFTVNERVVYIGKWTHGFFSMVPVGATNVGSMKMYFDPELTTNESMKFRFNYRDKVFRNEAAYFQPGDAFGEFNLGSTIVLIFEAPKSFRFSIKRGSSLKYGQEIGFLNPS